MDRRSFLKVLGVGTIATVAAYHGVTPEYVEFFTRKDVENDYFYTKFPQCPGTRFIYNPIDEIRRTGVIGHTKIIVEDVAKYWNKGLFHKMENGQVVQYEKYIMPQITNDKIAWLNRVSPKQKQL